MLRSHSKHNSEIDYFSSYLKEAQSGKSAYIDLVKPIILEAASLARGETQIADLDRQGYNIKLLLNKWGHTAIAAITQQNILEQLPMVQCIIDGYRAEMAE